MMQSSNNGSSDIAELPPQQRHSSTQKRNHSITSTATNKIDVRMSNRTPHSWTHIFDAILAQSSLKGPVSKRFRRNDDDHDRIHYHQEKPAYVPQYIRDFNARPEPSESTAYAKARNPQSALYSLQHEKLESNHKNHFFKQNNAPKGNYNERAYRFETESESPVSRSEKKRQREMKRRSDVNRGFDELTTLLVKMNTPEFHVEGKDGDERGVTSLSRVDLISKTVTLIDRLWKENTCMSQMLEMEKRKGKEKMVMLVPVMVPADKAVKMGDPIPSDTIPLPSMMPHHLMHGNSRPTMFHDPQRYGNSIERHGQSSHQWAQYAKTVRHMELVNALKESGMTHADLHEAIHMTSIPTSDRFIRHEF